MAKRTAKVPAKEETPGVVVQAPFFRRLGRRVGVSTAPIAGPPKVAPRPLHVAWMLALAHDIVRHIAEGTFADQADAARALGFTRARITQLVDLTLLAPAIQEQILFEEVAVGRDRPRGAVGSRATSSSPCGGLRRRPCRTRSHGTLAISFALGIVTFPDEPVIGVDAFHGTR